MSGRIARRIASASSTRNDRCNIFDFDIRLGARTGFCRGGVAGAVSLAALRAAPGFAGGEGVFEGACLAGGGAAFLIFAFDFDFGFGAAFLDFEAPFRDALLFFDFVLGFSFEFNLAFAFDFDLDLDFGFGLDARDFDDFAAARLRLLDFRTEEVFAIFFFFLVFVVTPDSPR
jgi:hypothetical protein